MFGKEKTLPRRGSQNPHHKGFRAKGEVMSMITQRLRERKEMALLGRPMVKIDIRTSIMSSARIDVMALILI